MRVMVLLNEAAGTLASSQTGDEPKRIRDGFVAAGVEADVRTVPGSELERTARQAAGEGMDGRTGGAGGGAGRGAGQVQESGAPAGAAPAAGVRYDAVIAGGGDGTLNTIANALAGNKAGTAFGVLPLGTHNHFAKEMGVPLNLEEAVAALARGQIKDLDVAEVNGRIFLNFSGLGLHPRVVREREQQQEAIGKGKLGRFARVGKIFLLFVALFKVLGRMRVMRLRLRSAGGPEFTRLTPLVMVCNNEHQVRIFGLEAVSHTERDKLNVYVAKATRWYGLVGLFVRALFKRLEQAHNFEALSLPEVTIRTRRRRARVSIDGEVTEMETPLRYRVRPGGLRVIVPAPPEGAGAGNGAGEGANEK